MKKFIEKIKIIHNLYFRNRCFLKRKSYSLDIEDQIIRKIFKQKKKGIYVDVGCYHPLEISNTALLYDKGWNGINIDLSEYTIKLFKFLKPDDINLNLAVSNRNGYLKFFYQKKLSKISTVNRNRSKKIFQGKIKEKKIPCKKLTKILDESKYKNKKIDLLNIDAEGHDLEVLKSLDFKRYRPKAICVEIFPDEGNFKNFALKNTSSYKFLINKKYKLYWSGFFSHIFIARKSKLNN